jgi:hypothetical protein
MMVGGTQVSPGGKILLSANVSLHHIVEDSIPSIDMADDILFDDFAPSEELIALLRDFTLECVTKKIEPNKLIPFARECVYAPCQLIFISSLTILHLLSQLLCGNGGREEIST